ncbi:hypothetical protein D3C76_1454870 [compost metagenome]
MGDGLLQRHHVKPRQQACCTASTQLTLAGPHPNAGTAAQIDQIVDGQRIHRITYLTGSHRFTLAHQAVVQPVARRDQAGAIAVAIHRRTPDAGR